MNAYWLILFRFVHILSGIMWGGAAVSYLLFVKPSVKAIGASGPQFMQSLMERRRYPQFMIATSLLTVLGGGVLFWNASGGFSSAWLRTGPGLGYTIGSLAALVAFLVGNAVIGPISGRMGAIGQQIGMSGGQPTLEQINEMNALEKRLSRAEWIDFAMLVVAMLTMATARYWIF